MGHGRSFVLTVYFHLHPWILSSCGLSFKCNSSTEFANILNLSVVVILVKEG